MNRAFGPLATPHLPKVATPVGWRCYHCHELISEHDSGSLMVELMELLGTEPSSVQLANGREVAIHRECEIRLLIGSVGHQRGLCSCNGGPGTLDDPPDVSRREAALLAEREMLARRPH